MRAYQTLPVPFLWNPLCYLEIAGGYLKYNRFWKPRFEIPLDSVEAEFHPKGRFLTGNLYGTGDLTIHSNRSRLEPISNVIRGGEFRAKIQKEKLRSEQERVSEEKRLAEELAEEKAREEADRVPEGLVFGTKTFSMPKMNGFLDDILYRQNYNNDYWEQLVDDRKWINQGEPICRLRTGDDDNVVIVSPVSGLLLLHGPWPAYQGPWFDMLLPKTFGEPLPSAEVFGPYCDWLNKERKRFVKRAGSGVPYAVTDELFDKHLESQQSIEYVIRDLKDLGSWHSQITSRAEKHPELRTNLKEVLDFIAEETSAMNPENAQEDVQSADPDAERAKFKAARQDALKYYELTIPFSKDELDKKRGELLLNALPAEVDKINSSYELILPLATD